MKIVINHQKPDRQPITARSSLPGPRCSLCLLCRPICLFSDTIFLTRRATETLGNAVRRVSLRRTLTSFSSREATLKLLKALVCQAERLDVTIHSSWQATGERGRFFFYPSILLPLLLLRLFLEATLIGIDFLLMSCHANGFQRGNTTLCRRQPGQAATKAVTKIPPMKADTSFRKFWERALSGALEW